MTLSRDERIDVELPRGTVAVSALLTLPDECWGGVALAHGAGAGPEHPFLVGVADALARRGVGVLRFAFPYREAGRRMPGPAAHATATWAAAMAALSGWCPAVPVFAAGKSYGGRMASLAAASGAIEPAALVYLGYPLHPPGEPEKERATHLPDISPPQLFLSGTRDPFVQPVDALERVVAGCRDATLAWVPGGGHSFEIAGRKRPAEAIGGELGDAVAAWLRERSPQRPAA
ncbi:dienelactone hydrolase family protein [Microbacterium sp. ET2]|uniref:alpha/beta hydrolase family protein n=1 Tax=Microbacterium albipurpureum TaxID=3050384 RepID=UPI00259CBAAA|nr:alpha/beta family hydrolase [Microbacterium sp. ET2 (Ac-2212)]WJL95931.1 dienelactone hydrolase family protein [Microbacterium sp. ET2 (Ac-2212)]